MVNYIETDYRDGIALLRASICNALQAIDQGAINNVEYEFISEHLVLDCVTRLNWEVTKKKLSPKNILYYVTSENNVCAEILIDLITGMVNITKNDKKSNTDV